MKKMILKEIFSKGFYLILEIVLFILFSGFFIIFPLFAVKGNDLKTQILFLKTKDYLMIFVLAFLIATNIVLMIYKKREFGIKIFPNISFGFSGGVLGIFSGLLTTSFCLSCLAPIFAFLGLGTGTLFLAFKYKFYIFLISISLLSLSLYLNLRQINKKKC